MVITTTNSIENATIEKSYSLAQSHSKQWNATISGGLEGSIGGGTQSGVSGSYEKDYKKVGASLSKLSNWSAKAHIEGAYQWGETETESSEWGKHIPGAKYYEIESRFGHDGFLLETDQITKILNEL